MSNSTDNVFNEWRTADRQAHELEQVLSKASLKALQGEGDAPSPEERDRARRLRQTADDLFHLAMAEMKARSEKARRY